MRGHVGAYVSSRHELGENKERMRRIIDISIIRWLNHRPLSRLDRLQNFLSLVVGQCDDIAVWYDADHLAELVCDSVWWNQRTADLPASVLSLEDDVHPSIDTDVRRVLKLNHGTLLSLYDSYA